MIKQLRIFIPFLIGFIYADVESWNSTTFEYLWNKYAYNTKFREPIGVTPFEVRVSQLSYIGPATKSDYFLPLPWLEITNADSSMIEIGNISSIYGLFDLENMGPSIVPLMFFDSKNEALNYLSK